MGDAPSVVYPMSVDWNRQPTQVVPEDVATRARPPVSSAKEAHLIGLLGSVAGHRYPVGDRVTIGRDAAAQIHVQAGDLSREHARIIRTKAGDYVIEDLGSCNGTLVNGVPVTMHVLRYGDTLQLGFGTSFIFTHHNPVEGTLVEAQALDSVGQLAAGVAHHFNNLMAVLHWNVSCLQKLPEQTGLGDENVRECIQDIQSAVKQSSNITRQLLGFARLGKYENRLVNLSHLIESVLVEMRQCAPEMQFAGKVEKGLRVRGDSSQIRQVLLDLCNNGYEATQGVGRVDIKAFADYAGSPGDSCPAPRPCVTIEVRDSGVGMDEETQRRAFQPFFTTKGRVRSTGLGLASVYGIVKNHGGDVRMESSLGQGTTFRVQLPQVADRTLPWRGAAKGQEVLVLIGHGDPATRTDVSKTLEALGCGVVEARDGREVIVNYLEHRDDLRLVLVDSALPGLGAAETCKLLRRIESSVKLVLTGRRELVELAEQLEVAHMMREPADAHAWKDLLGSLND